MAAGACCQSTAVPVEKWPGDEGKVIAGMWGQYVYRSRLYLIIWAGWFSCSFLGEGDQFGVACPSCIWGWKG